jgi:hypothetical protein
MRLLAATGCVGGCLAIFGLPLLAVTLIVSLVAALLGGVGLGLPGMGGLPGTFAACPAGGAPTVATAGIRNLCFGPSDAARLARTIASIRPDSPLVERAAWIVELGHHFGIDPLLIVQWQGESQMATDAPPRSANGPDNGGNLTWAAAEPYAVAWGCTPGANVSYPDGSYLFARCPSIEAGLGLWFAYVAGRYPAAAFPNLLAYAETYNSCAYPGNQSNGFLCGAAYAEHILALLAAHAGPPSAPIVGVAPGEYAFPVVGYTGVIALHWGSERGAADLFAAEGTPLVVMRGGSVVYAGFDQTGGWAVRIQGSDGLAYWYAHLRDAPLVRAGDVAATGQPLGSVGSTGNAAGTGAHLHLGIGPDIVAGAGPTGGAGTGGFDAVALLQAVYACCRR